MKSCNMTINMLPFSGPMSISRPQVIQERAKSREAFSKPGTAEEDHKLSTAVMTWGLITGRTPLVI